MVIARAWHRPASETIVVAGDGHGVITACCYHNPVVYYSRLVANFRKKGILFSSGDYPEALSSILSGEGLDESEQR